MIWVIGDIHGMFDPLKRLMTKLTELHHSGIEGFAIERLIFVGDYIDYGPSSKEVIDLLLDLPFEKVFLMGNHDDLLLQFVKKSDLFEKHGNVWFRGSGGQSTVMSFMPELACSDEDENYWGHQAKEVAPEDFALDERYLSFFENLKMHHIETIDRREVLFVHSMFSPELPLEEQMAISNYDEFHAWRQQRGLWIEDTFLWSRQEPEQRLGDYTVVHGHLPTPYLAKDWFKLHGYDPKTEIPCLKFETPEEEGVVIDFKATYRGYAYSAHQDPIAVNVDTGAVFGHRLSAVGFGDNWSTDGKLQVVQVSTKLGYRRSNELTYSTLYFRA
jgi:serine/threonine protein phosphatase 1